MFLPPLFTFHNTTCLEPTVDSLDNGPTADLPSALPSPLSPTDSIADSTPIGNA